MQNHSPCNTGFILNMLAIKATMVAVDFFPDAAAPV